MRYKLVTTTRTYSMCQNEYEGTANAFSAIGLSSMSPVLTDVIQIIINFGLSWEKYGG